MGKIKSRLIKRTGEKLKENKIKFSENFEDNKKILGNKMPSKKIRNRIAGYLTRIIKRENLKEKEIENQIRKKQ